MRWILASFGLLHSTLIAAYRTETDTFNRTNNNGSSSSSSYLNLFNQHHPIASFGTKLNHDAMMLHNNGLIIWTAPYRSNPLVHVKPAINDDHCTLASNELTDPLLLVFYLISRSHHSLLQPPPHIHTLHVPNVHAILFLYFLYVNYLFNIKCSFSLFFMILCSFRARLPFNIVIIKTLTFLDKNLMLFLKLLAS